MTEDRRCAWRTGHARCPRTHDLAAYESPAIATQPRLLCPEHLIEAQARVQQRFRSPNGGRPVAARSRHADVLWATPRVGARETAPPGAASGGAMMALSPGSEGVTSPPARHRVRRAVTTPRDRHEAPTADGRVLVACERGDRDA